MLGLNSVAEKKIMVDAVGIELLWAAASTLGSKANTAAGEWQ